VERAIPRERQSPFAEGEVRVAPRRLGRWRLLLSWSLEVGCGLLGGRRFYRARHLAPGRFLLRRERVEVPDLPAGLEGLRIAQLSDLHAGRFVREGDLAAVVDAVEAEAVDLVVLTGDYITHRAEDAFRLVGDLARLRPRLGSFAVFGNHDYRGRREAEIARRFAEAGVRFLRNEGARLERGGDCLYLSGVEDLEEGKRVDPRAARAGLEPGDVEVLLCHNPKGAELLAREGCVLVLSGHTHGGQIRLPLPRFLRHQIGPPHPGERLRHGPTTSIISRGLGVVALPLRFRAPTEVVLVTLERAAEGGSDGR